MKRLLALLIFFGFGCEPQLCFPQYHTPLISPGYWGYAVNYTLANKQDSQFAEVYSGAILVWNLPRKMTERDIVHYKQEFGQTRDSVGVVCTVPKGVTVKVCVGIDYNNFWVLGSIVGPQAYGAHWFPITLENRWDYIKTANAEVLGDGAALIDAAFLGSPEMLGVPNHIPDITKKVTKFIDIEGRSVHRTNIYKPMGGGVGLIR